MFGSLSQVLINFAAEVLSLLPEDPFADYLTANTDVQAVLGYVNWFLPVGTLIDITAAWLLAVALYYVYQIVLRWVKVIQ